MSNKSRSENRNRFLQTIEDEGLEDTIRELTRGVYRCDKLNLDIYPGTGWGKNYVTGERYNSLEKIIELLIKIKPKKSKSRNEYMEDLLSSILDVEEDSITTKVLKRCRGEEPSLKLVLEDTPENRELLKRLDIVEEDWL